MASRQASNSRNAGLGSAYSDRYSHPSRNLLSLHFFWPLSSYGFSGVRWENRWFSAPITLRYSFCICGCGLEPGGGARCDKPKSCKSAVTLLPHRHSASALLTVKSPSSPARCPCLTSSGSLCRFLLRCARARQNFAFRSHRIPPPANTFSDTGG